MDILEIIIYFGIALLSGFISSNNIKKWIIFAVSVLALYWFQPQSIVRYLDFFLPTLTLIIISLSWVITSNPDARHDKNNIYPAVFIAGIIFLTAATRYLSPVGIVTASRPPSIILVFFIVAIAAATWYFIWRKSVLSNTWHLVLIGILLIFFIILKSPGLSTFIGNGLIRLNHQRIPENSIIDIRWFGYSYIAFRLIHTLRDHQTGRLPEVNFLEYVVYVIFFPTLAAGPIDRLERFIGGLRASNRIQPDDVLIAFKRILFGLVKKFVIADSLSIIAISPNNTAQVQYAGWAWVMVYSYALMIFFDFSGYSDIAIGLGRLIGINLPENFNKPYIKKNLSLFWNSWHISLTQWFRAYYFNPLARKLSRSKRKISPITIIFFTQITTMLLIGLWHGITINFVLWGLWHGFGLFVHNLWAKNLVKFSERVQQKPILATVDRGISCFITFNYVALGWVWFALPDPQMAVRFGSLLFGLG